MRYLPVLLKDGYKVGHVFQYPEGTEIVYSNLTPRNSRREVDAGGVIFFGLQYFISEYLQTQFDENFFGRPREEVVAQYKRRMDTYLGPDSVNCDHIGALHDLGYLPLLIKAIPEGTFIPYGVPALTICNTHPEFFWLTNMLETLMSSVLWKASTSATTAMLYRRKFEEYAELTGSPTEGIQFQGHDFSMRGMCGVEDAAVSGAAHLLFFSGTDTLPAIDFLEYYYGANAETELVGVSVPATEHSVMCMGEPQGEMALFEHLITDIYPSGIVSVVSDTWDLWKVLTEYLPALKDVIMARDGKLVIRPDSGDPVKIICGDPYSPDVNERHGVIELLWDVFGGTHTDKGYKLLDSHIGMIYGDGINPARQEAILAGLAAKGFASGNVVLGLGSYTYQYVTRDTDGWAMKATAGYILGRGLVEIFKKPVTDVGSLKTSARGLLRVDREGDKLVLHQQVSEMDESGGELQTVFVDGSLTEFQTLADVRALAAVSV